MQREKDGKPDEGAALQINGPPIAMERAKSPSFERDIRICSIFTVKTDFLMIKVPKECQPIDIAKTVKNQQKTSKNDV